MKINKVRLTPKHALRFLAASALASTIVTGSGATRTMSSASAHSTAETVALYSPINGDSIWSKYGSQPANHHIVYKNWGYSNDWSVDIYRGAGSPVVSPFGSKTSTGQPTRVTVVGKVPGCASGNVADGGYRVTLEVVNASTNVVLGRADLMHVNNPAVAVGQQVGPWTTIGFTGQFRSSTCYQVSTAAGVHVHLEVINRHRYSCYSPRSDGAALTASTTIGKVGTHFDRQRAIC